MDRTTWLTQRRAAVHAAYDAEADTYDEYPNDAQRQWVGRLLATCPPGGVVLDAPCGTGRYFPLVAATGRTVVGADQSAGMLRAAARRDVATALHQIGLQELSFVAMFDAAVTIDSMENVPPEDWPLVFANLYRAIRPGSRLYMTVEETTDEEVDRAYSELTAQRLPAVRGEVVEGDVAGYHYYPGRAKVMQWLTETGWDVEDEGYTQEDGWGYRHLLLIRPGG